MSHPKAFNHLVEPIFLGVTELVDKREWNLALEKFQRLPALVRQAIHACLSRERETETVHTLLARTQMNSEFSVKIVGRRLEEFFLHTFKIPPLHSANDQSDVTVTRKNDDELRADHFDEDDFDIDLFAEDDFEYEMMDEDDEEEIAA